MSCVLKTVNKDLRLLLHLLYIRVTGIIPIVGSISMPYKHGNNHAERRSLFWFIHGVKNNGGKPN